MSKEVFNFNRRFNSFYARLSKALIEGTHFYGAFNGTLVEVEPQANETKGNEYNITIDGDKKSKMSVVDTYNLHKVINFIVDHIQKESDRTFNDEDFEAIVDQLDSTNGVGSELIRLEYKDVVYYVLNNKVFILDNKLITTGIQDKPNYDFFLEVMNGTQGKYVEIINMIEYVHVQNNPNLYSDVFTKQNNAIEKLFEIIEKEVIKLGKKDNLHALNKVIAFEDVNVALYVDKILKTYTLVTTDGYDILHSEVVADNLNELRITLNNFLWDITDAYIDETDIDDLITRLEN